MHNLYWIHVIHSFSIFIFINFHSCLFQPNPSSNVEPGAGEIVGGVLLLLLAVALIATIVVIVVVVVVVVVVRKCKGRHKQRSTSVSGGQGSNIMI